MQVLGAHSFFCLGGENMNMSRQPDIGDFACASPQCLHFRRTLAEEVRIRGEASRKLHAEFIAAHEEEYKAHANEREWRHPDERTVLGPVAMELMQLRNQLEAAQRDCKWRCLRVARMRFNFQFFPNGVPPLWQVAYDNAMEEHAAVPTPRFVMPPRKAPSSQSSRSV